MKKKSRKFSQPTFLVRRGCGTSVDKTSSSSSLFTSNLFKSEQVLTDPWSQGVCRVSARQSEPGESKEAAKVHSSPERSHVSICPGAIPVQFCSSSPFLARRCFSMSRLSFSCAQVTLMLPGPETLSHGKCFDSRFAQVDSRTNASTSSLYQ